MAKNKIVKQRYGCDFNLSLGNSDVFLKPGVYDLMIDPMWDESANNNPEYKKVLLDIYSIYKTIIVPLKFESGM